jgi:hypothetical protein
MNMIALDRRTLLKLSLASAVPLKAAIASSLAERDAAAAERLDREGIAAERERVRVRVEPGTPPTVAEALADRVENGLGLVEQALGKTMDSPHYGGDRVSIYAVANLSVSHTFDSFNHPQHNKPFVYFPLRMVQADTEPYLHELTHIILWAYGSRSLREGFANWVMLSKPRYSGKPNRIHVGITGRAGTDQFSAELLRSPEGGSVLAAMGTTGPFEGAFGGEGRGSVYIASTSFVYFLLEHVPLPAFMELHISNDPESAMPALTGRDLATWRRDWLNHLCVDPDSVPRG